MYYSELEHNISSSSYTREKDQKSAVDVIIRTYNSGATLEKCISSVMKMKDLGRIIVIDHMSKDNTEAICRNAGCEYYREDKGLGFATSTGILKSNTPYVLFVDSDVQVLDFDFIPAGKKFLSDGKTGAVVGDTLDHPFSYGVPLGLTMFRRSDLLQIRIPDSIQGRETYFIQKYLRENHLRVRYIRNAKIHSSPVRSNIHWPEWQGSYVRITSGLNLREFLYSHLVIFLLLSNSKRLKNLIYFPVFQAKFTRGFLFPEKWKNMKREPS